MILSFSACERLTRSAAVYLDKKTVNVQKNIIRKYYKCN